MSFNNQNKSNIKLTGFNNLQKILTINMFDFTIVNNEFERDEYIKYIYNKFNSSKLEKLISKISENIDAEILDVSKQDFDPYGASALILLGEPVGDSKITAHLNKSHISVHTYPDFDSNDNILSFRVDIDISTCGNIVPLSSLNNLFKFFDMDIFIIDFLVRGFTKDANGLKIFNDFFFDNFNEFLSDDIKKKYIVEDYYSEKYNFWQSKFIRSENIISEFFHPDAVLDDNSEKKFMKLLKEMDEVYTNTN